MDVPVSQSRSLAGVLPVVQCPFDETGAIDHAVLRSESHWVLDQGVAGLTTGMVSEVLRLTESERHAQAETVVSVAKERGALSVISAGAESTVTAVAFAEHAAAIGADAIMVIPPISVGLDDDAMFDYYSAVAAAGVLVVVQDASGYVGRPLTIELQQRLLERFGDQVYFKPEAAPIGTRLSLLREATGGRARVLEGMGGSALIDSFRRGVVGTMPGAEVCWAVQAIWEALQEENWSRAYDISGPLLALVNLQTSIDEFIAVEKHLLHRQGVFTSTASRAPLSFELDQETREEVDRLFDRLAAAAGHSVQA